MLQPDHHVDHALQVALERVQEIASQKRHVKGDAEQAGGCLRDLLWQIATSSQVTPEQRLQLQQVLTLVEAVVPADTKRSRRATPRLIQQDGEPEIKRGRAYALLTVRDINLICQEYGDAYALVEGETRRHKINRARRRQGVLEARTAARDEWKGPIAWIEWVNDLDILVRYLAQDIR